MKFLNAKQTHGITSLEVVGGVSIAGIMLTFVMNAVSLFINSARDVVIETQALYLAEEGLEVVQFVRDSDWDTFRILPSQTVQYLSITPSLITITNTPEVIDEFTRGFVVDEVYRDPGTDDVVASTTVGSVADPDSKYVTMTVGWGTEGKKVSLTTLLADISP